MSSNCLFCFKKCACHKATGYGSSRTPKCESQSQPGKILSQFQNLVWRYLTPAEEKSGASLKMQTFSSSQNQIHTCRKCLQIVQSVCDLYHDMQKMELRLNWKLNMLVSLMQDGQDAPENGQSGGSGGHHLKINELRKTLKERCLAKFSKFSPKVKLTRMETTNTSHFTEAATINFPETSSASALLRQPSASLNKSKTNKNPKYKATGSPNLPLDAEMATPNCGGEATVQNWAHLQELNIDEDLGQKDEDEALNNSSTIDFGSGTRPEKFKFKCEICSKPITDKWKLNRHLKTHKGRLSIPPISKSTEVSQSKKAVKPTVPNSESLQEPVKNFNDEDPSPNPLVHNDAFNHPTPVNTDPGKFKFECLVCGKGITDRWKLNRHLNTHKPKDPISKPLNSAEVQKIEINNGIFAETCPEIKMEVDPNPGASYDISLDFDLGKNSSPLYIPAEQDSVSDSNVEVEQDITTDTSSDDDDNHDKMFPGTASGSRPRPPKNFKCEECDKAFRDKWHLKRHQRQRRHQNKTEPQSGVKTGVKGKQKSRVQRGPGIECKLCRKIFRDAYNLARHLRTHNNVGAAGRDSIE